MGTTVVIPQRNRGGSRLWNCLNALRRQTVPPEEVIVSDLSSGPDQLDNIRGITLNLGCTFLRTEWSGKFSRSVAVNMGIRAARSDHIVVLDVDAVAAPDCLERFEQVVPADTLVLGEHRRGYAAGHEEDISTDWASYFVASVANPWPHVAAGMFMGAARNFWMRIGGYDERFKGWGAEDDFVVWKAAQVGGVTWIDMPLLIHQDHPEVEGKEADRAANHQLFERLKQRKDWPGRWGVRKVVEHTRNVLHPVRAQNPKYKALFFLDASPPFLHAGAEYAALGLARALRERGHPAAVVTRQGAGHEEVFGVPVYGGAPDWGDAALHDHIDRFQPSVCFSQYGSVGATSAACRARGVKHAAYCHTHHGYEGYPVSAADVWLFTSAALWDESGRFGGGRALPLRPPLITGRVVSSAKRRKRRGWVRNAVTVINTSQDKGGDVTLALASRMPQQRFLVIPGGYGEPVHELEWLSNVDVYPVSGDLTGFFAQSLVHLVPSHSETYGMVATEALLAGVPVLATDMPSLREATMGEGVLLPDRDVSRWHAALLEALSRRPRVSLGAQYRERLSSDLDALEQRLW